MLLFTRAHIHRGTQPELKSIMNVHRTIQRCKNAIRIFASANLLITSKSNVFHYAWDIVVLHWTSSHTRYSSLYFQHPPYCCSFVTHFPLIPAKACIHKYVQASNKSLVTMEILLRWNTLTLVAQYEIECVRETEEQNKKKKNEDYVEN